MAKVYITDGIINPDIERAILASNVSIDFDKNAEILIVWNKVINADYLKQFLNLKSIIRCGIGYDIIDLKYTKSKGIKVSNIPDYCINEVADTSVGLILNIVRGISYMDAYVRKVKSGWQEHTLKTLKRTSFVTVGIIGAGNIGCNAISKLTCIGLKCIYYDPYIKKDLENSTSVKRVNTIKELLNQSDIVSIYTPLNTSTKGMVNKEFLNMMKKGSSLVNVSRGKVVESLDLIYEFLKNGHLFSVAFDVLPDEPPIESKLINAWKTREEFLDGRIIINPHSAFYSIESYLDARKKSALNAKGIIEGKKQLNIVNF